MKTRSPYRPVYESSEHNITPTARSTAAQQTPNHDLRFRYFILFEDGCRSQTFIIPQTQRHISHRRENKTQHLVFISF